jgi:hypothetical protein
VPAGSALGELITRKRDDIVAAWEAGVRTLASGAESGPALVDRVPAFLEWLAARLGKAGAADAQRDAFSHRHARERLSRGFDFVEIVAEWGLLRECLLEAWEAEPDGVTPGEIRRMNAELDHVVALAVVEYARARGGAGEQRPAGGA